MLPIHRDYLAKRGIDPDRAASEWGVKGINQDGGRYAWRLFLPALRDGRPVSWTTRAIGKSAQLRYLAATPDAETFPLKRLLYGAQHCRHAVAVVEGPLCAVWCGPGFVATCGVDVTPSQVRKIAAFPVRVVCFDSSPDAQLAARKLCSQLESWPGETYNVVSSGKALDESPPEEAAEVRARFLT